MSYRYSAYGLIFQLPFPCPALPIAPPGDTADVVIQYGSVPPTLAGYLAAEERWQTNMEQFLYRAGRRVGRFLLQGGNAITIDRADEATDEMLCSFLLDRLMPFLLEQRGLVVLHASTVVTSQHAVAITGVSGAGKSTLLAALLAQGCTMLADDISAISLAGTAPVVLPGLPEYNLCDDAAERLGQPIDRLLRPRWRAAKVIVPADRRYVSMPVELHAVYYLRVADCDELSIKPVAGWQKFDLLRQQRYGMSLPEMWELHFAQLTTIAEQADVFTVVRPRHRWTISTLVDLILSGMAKPSVDAGV